MQEENGTGPRCCYSFCLFTNQAACSAYLFRLFGYVLSVVFDCEIIFKSPSFSLKSFIINGDLISELKSVIE